MWERSRSLRIKGFEEAPEALEETPDGPPPVSGHLIFQQTHLFVGGVARELWASKENELRASDIDEFFGKFRTEGIFGKAVAILIVALRDGDSAQSLQQHEQVLASHVLDFANAT